MVVLAGLSGIAALLGVSARALDRKASGGLERPGVARRFA